MEYCCIYAEVLLEKTNASGISGYHYTFRSNVEYIAIYSVPCIHEKWSTDSIV